jgi:tungstate transport system ATP-binding protein
MYQLEHITKTYGARQVLGIASLEVRGGEILAVVGPSGAGKSTLLRLLNFLEPPTNGLIQFAQKRFGPRDIVPLELRRQVTTVFQQPALFSTNVFDNVAYGLRVRGRAQARAMVMGALDQVGLAHLATASARTLSGGERQRCALARALVFGPRVLLLDEPTANLDPRNVQVIEQVVSDMQRRSNTTVVLVTHNLFQARRLAHRTALLLDGSVVEISETRAFFNAPRDPRTAAFVRGEMVY